MSNDRPLLEWARRFRVSCPGPSQHLREKMEAMLVPMICCAIRAGLGQPPLVRWVRERLPLLMPDQQVDPVRQAVPLARELSERLMTQLEPVSDRDTVFGV